MTAVPLRFSRVIARSGAILLAFGCGAEPPVRAPEAPVVDVDPGGREATIPMPEPPAASDPAPSDSDPFGQQLDALLAVPVADDAPGDYAEDGFPRDDAVIAHWMAGTPSERAQHGSRLPAVRAAARRFLSQNPMVPVWLSEIGREGYCELGKNLQRMAELDGPSDQALVEAFLAAFCPNAPEAPRPEPASGAGPVQAPAPQP